MVNSPTKSEEEDEENDLFYFESDHLALKGNKDYSELLKTLFILQAQQKHAIRDFDKVVKIHKEALNNPLKAVEKLKTPEGLGIPKIQTIAEIPVINWSKYDVGIPQDGLKSVNYDTVKASGKHRHKSTGDQDIISETHNKPWTTEEQKRLEELLVIYPPEPIEIKRFKKIAAALGNRTSKQVCSRVQKYFLKLYKAGLPIPGRIPKSITKHKKSLHKHQRYNHYLWRPTTFFPELDIPVVMNDAEDVPGPCSSSATGKSDAASCSNYLIPGTYHTDLKQDKKSIEQYQLDTLKRVRDEKEREMAADYKFFCHIGFRCDYCNEEPIKGTRWHCTACVNNSVDFCTDCVISQMYTENCHPFSHTLTTIRGSKSNTTSSYSDSDSSLSSIKNYESSNDEDEEKCTVKREYNISDLEAEPEATYEDKSFSSDIGHATGETEEENMESVENSVDERYIKSEEKESIEEGSNMETHDYMEQIGDSVESELINDNQVPNLQYDLHTITHFFSK